MSEKLCALRKIGGGMSEKVLWTNANPTSSFNASACSLSESVDNFDYIKVLYRVSTSNSTQGSALWPVATIKTSSGGANKIRASFASQNANSVIYARIIGYNNAQSLQIGVSSVWGQSLNDNTTVIPLNIIGIKVS